MEHLGSGGFGDVWAAFDGDAQKRVAIKILRQASDPMHRRRFEREVRAAGRITHPVFVTIFDVFECGDGRPGFSMELLDGETLRDRLKRDGTLSLEQTVEVLLPVVRGVAAMHTRQLAHRDLKPANVFLERHGAIRVLDFGIVKLLPGSEFEPGSLLTALDVTVGTPGYMAPEQLISPAQTDHRADVWAIGVVLYEMLTGARLFEGNDARELMRRVLTAGIMPIELLVPEVPRRLAALVTQALVRDPERRLSSVSPIADELQKQQSNTPSS